MGGRVAGARDEEFSAFVAGSARRLRRVAFLLCGDWQLAEDLVQTALVKLYLAWDRVRSAAALDAFLRTTLVREFLNEGRRPWRRERPLANLPEVPLAEGEFATEDRLLVRQALAQVPPRQRTVLVLRFLDDCDVAETARVMGCSEGTVKSQTARGLDRLRQLLALTEPDPVTCPEG
jgi:RNA polymerase sigma-70 factor (sigma-E family)